MKILFVANRVPYPPFRGDKLKIYNLAKRLSVNNELYLITFAESEEDFQYQGKLEEIFREVHFIHLPRIQSYINCLKALFTRTPFQIAYFKSGEMDREVREFLSTHKVDVIHTQHLRMAQFTMNIQQPKILDLPDAFSLYWKRRIANEGSWIKRILERIEFNRLYRFEGETAGKFDQALVCSREDLEYMKQEHGVKGIDLLRNGVDLSTFHSAGHNYLQHEIILFTGNMDYAPNVDAVLYFAREIFPIIQEHMPETMFVIAGQRPVRKVLELRSDQIVVTGFVPDLREMYLQAAVVVSPLRFGAGTQNKVLEAMAMGVPVVSGQVGFQGLEVTNGEGVFLETTPDGFASRTIELLRSAELRQHTGEAGQKIAHARFSWDSIAARLQTYCETCAKH